MKQLLSKLRSQSDEVKTKIAILGAILVTAGIIALWIFLLPSSLSGNAIEKKSTETDTPSPLRALFDSISQATKSVQDQKKDFDSEPEVSTPDGVSQDAAYDESSPAPTGTYAGEQVFLEG